MTLLHKQHVLVVCISLQEGGLGNTALDDLEITSFEQK